MADDAQLPDLATIGQAVDWPDYAAASAARERLAGPGSRYGRLADLGEWLAGARGAVPESLERPRVVCFTGVEERTNEVAALSGVGRRDVPIGHPAQFGADEVTRAVANGAHIADDEIDSGADLFVIAVGGSPTRAAAVVSVLTDTEPAKVLARGADATDPDAWMRRAVEVRDLRRRGRGHRGDPAGLLAAIGSPELATAAGFLLQAAARRTPVLLDGLGAASAALLGYEAKPRAVRWWRAADRTPGPAHELAMMTLALEPVLDLGLGLEDGTAGILAVPVLRAAIRALQAETERNTTEDGLAPTQTQSSETQSSETLSSETQSAETLPAEALPAEALPAEAQSAETLPAE